MLKRRMKRPLVKIKSNNNLSLGFNESIGGVVVITIQFCKSLHQRLSRRERHLVRSSLVIWEGSTHVHHILHEEVVMILHH